jgi:glycosyltransferase involved in cell wall biosynthesis
LSKIGWYSNAPDTPTGYGVQTAQVCRRLRADGHEVHILANYGQIAGVRDWEGCAVWPQGVYQYGLDVLEEQVKLTGVDFVFTLYDVWPIKGAFGDDARVISWTPVDHWPPPPEVLSWSREHETVAMSQYGAEALAKSGVDVLATIPHAVESTFHPDGPHQRARMNVPQDAYVVGLNAANIGVTPPRKNFSGQLEAVSVLMHRHEDVYLYLHTDLMRPTGMPIHVLISALGIPKERVVVVPPALYRGGLIAPPEMAELYRSLDVLLMATKGEGFGVPIIEAMAVGVPSIVSDFAAAPTIIGETGWRVPGQLDWDHNQGAWFTTPFTAAIVEALEESYAERGTDKATARKAACVEHSADYRADHVYETQWRPLIEHLEQKPPERKGMSNAAKRRARKAKK